MKSLFAAGFCSFALGLAGCASEPATDSGVSEGDLSSTLKANEALTCAADSGGTKLALVTSTQAGKVTLLTLTPAADLYALSGSTGTLTASSSKWSWNAAGSSLTLGANLKGTWQQGAQTTSVACAKAASTDAASWAAANALVTYASEIEGLADTITEEMNSIGNRSATANASAKPNVYTVFAVETARRDSLALGTIAKGTSGTLPGENNESLLDENDFSYGGMSAAYSLGGGEDYGEWFQGASDGISLTADVVPSLGTAGAGFVAHEKVTALSTLVDSAAPSAVAITVGTWTFFLPDALAK